MKIIGIIVEYNPMHKGHLNHINEIKKKYNNSLIIAVMSGNISQRGELTIYDKFIRAKTAIENGVDIVVQLPLYYSLNNANIFAEGSVKYLNKFNVEKIIYGSESNDQKSNTKIAKKLSKEKYQNELKDLKNKYHSLPVSFEKFLNGQKIKSNDILGICYTLEGLKQNKKIKFETIKRNNEDFPTAKSLRQDIKSNSKNEFSLINTERKLDINDFFELIKSKIITTNINDNLIKYIKNKLKENNYSSWDELINDSANKSFTKSRIQREILKFFFEIKYYDETPRLLGISKRGSNYLKEIDLKYNTKFKKEYKNDLVVAEILNLKYENFKEKEIKTICYIKNKIL